MNWYKKAIREYNYDKDTFYWKILEKEQPFKENDIIRVFHAFNSMNDAIMTTKYGLSGKERAERRYSYESNNNPYGLFVTTDFKTSTEFTIYGAVMEFNAKYSELESPVWPGGGYTVQGQMEQYWSWDKLNEQREEARLKQREKALKNEFEAIRKSDRPELAESLMLPREYQALFVGDLNPNRIDAIWIRIQEKEYPSIDDKWERLTVEEFLNRIGDIEEKLKSERIDKTLPPKYYKLQNKIFTPEDEFNPATLINKLNEGYHSSMEELIKSFGKEQTKIFLKDYVWPKQVESLNKWIDSL